MTFADFCRIRHDPKVPSPCQYDIPSSFGSGPKYSMRSRHETVDRGFNVEYRALPSTLSKKGCTIGPLTPRRKPADDVPGPSYVTSTIGQGRKTKIQERRQQSLEETPGPGDYDVPTGFTGQGCSIGVGKRVGFDGDSNPHVGPGSYSIPSEMEQRRPMTVRTRPKEGFKKKPHPGPKYNIRRETGSDARKCAFPKGPRDVPIPQTPGPGDYDVPSDPAGKTKIGTTLKSRHRAREQEVNRMPYYDVGTTINPKPKSIGNRPKTSYETISPGPYYNIGGTIVPRKKSIGVRTAIKNPHDDVPSPDSYWMTPDPPRPPPIAGFPGPDDRSIVNEREEAKKPGPGYYEQKDLFVPGAKGYKFSTQPNIEEKPDTAAPYHACKSTLGGPMFTIGRRDV